MNQPKSVIYNYCEEEDHLKCEWKIQVMIDRMKDLKWVSKKKNRLHWQVNVVDEALVLEEKLNVEEEGEDFVDLNNIEACIIKL